MEPFKYESLPTQTSIRILILYPAADTSTPLEVDLLIKDRYELLCDPRNSTYNAVSYVWGEGAHDIPLYCPSQARYFYISAVVDGMLRTLRKGHKEMRLWIDALCLNQKDDQEKSIQVQQMGQIYHMANKVYIWLGPANPSVPSAFTFLRALVAKFEPTPSEAKDPTVKEIFDTCEETFKYRTLQDIMFLLQQPWFTRRWTLQEGFLAREAVVRCGSHKIPWHWFTAGLRLIHNRAQELRIIQDNQNALHALDVLNMLREPGDLLTLLWTFHQNHCSDPRDRIYSLLGLAQNMNRANRYCDEFHHLSDPRHDHDESKKQMPSPDYRLDEGAVFRGFISHCIWTGRFLHVLFHLDSFGSLSEVNRKYSSWIPNWAASRVRTCNSLEATSELMPGIQCIDKDIYYSTGQVSYRSASPLLPKEFVFIRPIEFMKGSHHGLILHGLYCQQIVEICKPWPENDDNGNLATYLTDWVHKDSILHLPESKRGYSRIRSEVVKRLLLLLTGPHFFGYAKHKLLETIQDTDDCIRYDHNRPPPLTNTMSKLIGISDTLYPVIRRSRLYTIEDLKLKQHMDWNYNTVQRPTIESRQDLLHFLDSFSAMMQEGKKRLIVTCSSDPMTAQERRHWIGPRDVKPGDVITSITTSGNIGVLLRPHDSPSTIDGQPVFRIIGTLWTVDDVHLDGSSKTKSNNPGFDEFTIV
ncbi:het domain-containing [Fusarium longipes]|uniref:Het domain-containing n=1 Tax=Fusarium longipes TaxID=694270 RepID=A0A395RZL6_9HYPO|nr:het domain-containing [Fusarium longipes]